METLTCDIPIRKQSLQLKLIHLTTCMYILELVVKNLAAYLELDFPVN